MTDHPTKGVTQEGIEAALLRAAARARRIAAEAGRPIVIYENGQIVKLSVFEDRDARPVERDAG